MAPHYSVGLCAYDAGGEAFDTGSGPWAFSASNRASLWPEDLPALACYSPCSRDMMASVLEDLSNLPQKVTAGELNDEDAAPFAEVDGGHGDATTA